jgi:hypothetical protein
MKKMILLIPLKKRSVLNQRKKRNYTDVETSGTPYYQEPNPIAREEPLKSYVADEDRLNFYDDDEVIARPAKPKTADLEPKTSREVTLDLALPPPISPGRLMAINFLKQADERKLKREAAKAEIEAAAKGTIRTIISIST